MPPFITIICPVYNEEKFVASCIDSILAQDYQKNNMEFLLVDGVSMDRTRNIVNNYTEKFSFIRLLDNPNKTPPFAMNIGIRQAKGEYIIRIDGHSIYPFDYISKLVDNAIKLNADNVGGICVTEVNPVTPKTKAIKEVLSNRFGVGNSFFRTGNLHSITEVDTVPFGCFKQDVFDRVGLYDERLTRNQDIELNKRIKAAGGKIYLVPDIQCTYLARNSFKALVKNNYANGKWNILTVFYTHNFRSLSFRHFVPLLFVLSFLMPVLFSIVYKSLIWIAITSLLLYVLCISIVSMQICWRKRINWFYLVVAFLCLHFSYGIGSLMGIASGINSKNE